MKKKLEVSIINEYLQALFFKDAIKIAKERLYNSSKQLERIKALYKSQSVTKAEFLENQSLVELDKNNLTSSENKLKNTLLKLKELISIEDIESFDIEQMSIEDLDKLFTKENITYSNDNQLYNHPSILVLESEKKIKEKQVQINKSAYYPIVSFNYSYNTRYYHLWGKEDVVYNRQTKKFEDNGFLKQLDNNKTHYLGFSVTIPIFNRFQMNEAYEKSKLDYQISQINLENEKKQISNQVDQIYNDVLTTKASLKSLRKILKFQEELFQISTEKYELGANSVYDFIQSRNRLFKAQTDYIKVKCEYLHQRKALNFYSVNL